MRWPRPLAANGCGARRMLSGSENSCTRSSEGIRTLVSWGKLCEGLPVAHPAMGPEPVSALPGSHPAPHSHNVVLGYLWRLPPAMSPSPDLGTPWLCCAALKTFVCEPIEWQQTHPAAMFNLGLQHGGAQARAAIPQRRTTNLPASLPGVVPADPAEPQRGPRRSGGSIWRGFARWSFEWGREEQAVPLHIDASQAGSP